MAGTVVLSDELNQLICIFAIEPSSLAKILRTDLITLSGWLADNQPYPQGASRAALAELVTLSERLGEMFRSPEGIAAWVHGASGYLGGQTPLDFLLVGKIDQVNLALDAIEIGIFV